MRIRKLSILFVSSLAVLVGCSSSGDGDSDGSNPAIQGTWETICFVNGDNRFQKDALDVNGTNFTQTFSYYDDAECTVLGARSLLTGDFVEGESTEDSTPIDITFAGLSEELYVPADIEFSNDNARCGISNWESGVSFDVTNCADAIDAIPMPLTVYHIYQVSGTDLYFGDPGFSQTEEGRPTELSATPGYSRP